MHAISLYPEPAEIYKKHDGQSAESFRVAPLTAEHQEAKAASRALHFGYNPDLSVDRARAARESAGRDPKADFSVRNHGSLFLVTPISAAAFRWLSENVQGDVVWFGDSLPVEPRYIDSLVLGMEDAGLVR